MSSNQPHDVLIRPWDGPSGPVFEARCPCGWRGPSIATHYFLSDADARLGYAQHLAQVAQLAAA